MMSKLVNFSVYIHWTVSSDSSYALCILVLGSMSTCLKMVQKSFMHQEIILYIKVFIFGWKTTYSSTHVLYKSTYRKENFLQVDTYNYRSTYGNLFLAIGRHMHSIDLHVCYSIKVCKVLFYVLTEHVDLQATHCLDRSTHCLNRSTHGSYRSTY